MEEFFKKHIKWLFITFVVPLLLSYFWFALNGVFPSGEIAKASWLSFWGSFLSFYGTFFLGLVAVWQNTNANAEIKRTNAMSVELLRLTEQANAINKRLADIEDYRHSCNVILYINSKDSAGNTSSTVLLHNEPIDRFDISEERLYFCIMNHGEAVLKRIEVFYSESSVFASYISLAKGEFKNVSIPMPAGETITDRIKTNFISCNESITHGDFVIDYSRIQPHIKEYHFYGCLKTSECTIT